MYNDDERWDEIENYDVIETGMTQVENDDNCGSRNGKVAERKHDSMDCLEHTNEKMLNCIQNQR